MASAAFEPSLSASAIRAPYSTADAPSMADSLPSVNFGFEDLREQMARFTARFDDFIEQGRKRVLEERNQFRMNVAELQEDQRQRKRDIEITTLKTQTHQQTLQKEHQETAEMHQAIDSLSSTRAEHQADHKALSSQINDVKKSIASRRSAITSHRAHLAAQSRFNAPELDFWQSYLCLRIEGAGVADRLKFVFTHVCEKDWEREAWFELGTGNRDYQVFGIRPKVEREEVEAVLERLNESRDLTPFLKGMRGLFVESMK